MILERLKAGSPTFPLSGFPALPLPFTVDLILHVID
jgi:hypothetical protein